MRQGLDSICALRTVTTISWRPRWEPGCATVGQRWRKMAASIIRNQLRPHPKKSTWKMPFSSKQAGLQVEKQSVWLQMEPRLFTTDLRSKLWQQHERSQYMKKKVGRHPQGDVITKWTLKRYSVKLPLRFLFFSYNIPYTGTHLNQVLTMLMVSIMGDDLTALSLALSIAV